MNESQRELIGGRYQIVTTLGRGGMGVVYKAYDPVLERDVAIKQMGTSMVDSDEHRRRFQIEARAAARLNHPNIVTIYELEEHHGDVFIVMELLEGLSLGALLQRRTPPPLEAQLTILAQVCDGLDFAHSRAIVHRDIKPANLVLLPSGVVKILDFGIAQLAASDLTRQGAVLGTPNYMAPEQVNGEQVDSRADLFSVGAVAYELASGMKAFSADSVPALLMKIAEASYTPLPQVAPEVAPGLAALVTRLLSKSRDGRPARGGEVRAALEEIGAVDRLDLVADAVAEALSPSEGDTLVQLTPRDRSTTPVASRSVVSPHRANTPTRLGGDAGQPPPLPGAVLGGRAVPTTENLGPSVPPQDGESGGTLSSGADTGAPGSAVVPSPSPSPLSPSPLSSAPPALPPGVMPPSLADAPSAAGAGPHAVAHAAAISAASAAVPGIAPQALVGSSGGAASAGQSSSQKPAGRVTGEVPAARRAGKGTAIVMLGLAAVLIGIFIGASYMWWQRLRGEIKPHVTTASQATPSNPDAATSSASPAPPSSSSADSGAQASGDAKAVAPPPAGASAAGASAADASTAPSTVANPGAGTPATPGGDASSASRPPAEGASAPPATSSVAPPPGGPPTSTSAPAPAATSSATPPLPGPGASTTTSASVASSSSPTPKPPSETKPPPEATREASRAARDASSASVPVAVPPARPQQDRPRSVTPDLRASREPAPPVDAAPPPPPPSSSTRSPSTASPDAPPEPGVPPDAAARAPRGGPPPRTTVDAETLSAFQRSGDATAVLGGDETMVAAATVRIKDTLERYGKAIQERDLDTLRALRETIAPAEQKLLDGPGATVRFTDIDVDVLDPTQATARARRIVSISGQSPATDSVSIHLTRKPTGWVITSIAR